MCIKVGAEDANFTKTSFVLVTHVLMVGDGVEASSQTSSGHITFAVTTASEDYNGLKEGLAPVWEEVSKQTNKGWHHRH